MTLVAALLAAGAATYSARLQQPPGERHQLDPRQAAPGGPSTSDG